MFTCLFLTVLSRFFPWMAWESNEAPGADSQHVRWNNDLNSSAAVVSHISSILRIAERLNKKREINTQEDRV